MEASIELWPISWAQGSLGTPDLEKSKGLLRKGLHLSTGGSFGLMALAPIQLWESRQVCMLPSLRRCQLRSIESCGLPSGPDNLPAGAPLTQKRNDCWARHSLEHLPLLWVPGSWTCRWGPRREKEEELVHLSKQRRGSLSRSRRWTQHLRSYKCTVHTLTNTHTHSESKDNLPCRQTHSGDESRVRMVTVETCPGIPNGEIKHKSKIQRDGNDERWNEIASRGWCRCPNSCIVELLNIGIVIVIGVIKIYETGNRRQAIMKQNNEGTFPWDFFNKDVIWNREGFTRFQTELIKYAIPL